MQNFWKNRFFKIGAIIALVGWSPLLVIVFAEAIGLSSGSNPIGLGLLFFFSFWPAMICLGIGSFQAWRSRR